MANIYVRSTDGNDADSGATWALAKATLAGATAIDAAGDRIYLSQSHSESVGSSQTYAFAGTAASPVRLIAGNDAAEPPTTKATATVATSGASDQTFTGTFYAYGVTFSCGTGTSTSARMVFNNTSGNQVLEACDLVIGRTGGGGAIRFGNGNGGILSNVEMLNSRLKFGSTTDTVSISGKLLIRGGSIMSGSAAAANLFTPNLTAGPAFDLLMEGFDLSNLGSGVNLVAGGSANQPVRAVFRNCKLPASWSGGVWSSSPNSMGQRAEMYNCDSADTNYRLWIETYAGSIKSETVIVRTGGASDGTTPISWKMATTANASFPVTTLESSEIVQWNETTGSSLTATLEIVHDSQGAGTGSRFQDDEVWIEVQYLGTSGYPLGTFLADVKSDVLASAVDQADSSETWTTTGLTTPVKQKLSVTFTPQEKGFIHAKVVMAKASKTCYVCPKLTVA